MYIYELDAHNHTVPGNDHRKSDSCSASSSGGHSYTTAGPVQQANDGLDITNLSSAGDDNNPPVSTCPQQLAMRAAALGSHGSRWLGDGLSAEPRAESRGLGSHLDPRNRLLYKLRSADRRWQRRPEDDGEAWEELVTFLRTVTPPPTNYMSVPTEPYSPSLSSRSSIKRGGSRNSRRKKKGPLARCLQFFKGRSKKRKSVSKAPAVRAPSPPVVRAASRKHKRPPQIKLPDTAIAGRTVDGHRHIAISIPVEYAHLSPQSKDGFRKASRRTQSMPSVELIPAVHNNSNLRPMSAFANESHVGTHLGSVAEEQRSLSSGYRSWARDSQRGQEEAPGPGIASRNTFGTAQEEASSPVSESMSPPRIPRRTSDRYDTLSVGRPSTSQTNDDSRDAARRKTLAALSRPQTASRPVSAVSVQSAYSFRSFATPSPSSRVYYPTRKTSLRFGPQNHDQTLAPGVSGQGGRDPSSRDSSRDKYTKQESIFSERSFLDTTGTGDSDSEAESGVIPEGMQAIGYPLPAGNVHTATPPSTMFGGEHYENAREVEENCERRSNRTSVQENMRNSVQETRRSSRHEFDTAPIWKQRGQEAPLTINSEMRTVETHATRKSQMRDSVAVVLETPTEASWSSGLGETSGEEDEDGLRDAGDDPRNETDIKGKEKDIFPENTLTLTVPGGDTKPPSSMPDFKKRGGRRKEVLLSREQKIANLKQKLEAPGMEPKDLVWRRNSSSSSDGSSDECEPKDQGTAAEKMMPNQLSSVLESNSNNFEATPGRFSLSAVMTVADVKPSSLRTATPDLGITSPLSTSSSATMATAVKTSPMPLYRSLGSVTPPDSSPSSPASSSPVSSVEAQPRGTPLQHPPCRHLNSSWRRPSTSGIQRDVSSGMGFPSINDSPSRPRTASNGLLPSHFHSERYIQEEGNLEGITSITETPRGKPTGPYEVQGEEKVQDMERRLMKLERYRDQWMTSMIPLLTDMGQALGTMATSSGKGKVVDRSPQAEREPRHLNTSNSDSKKNRTWRRDSTSEDADSNTRTPTRDDQDDRLDSDEVIVHHHPRHVRTGRSRAGTNTSECSRRLYPLDEAPRHPSLDYHDDDDERPARSSPRRERDSSRLPRDRGRTTSVPLPSPQTRARTSSGMRTVVDYDDDNDNRRRGVPSSRAPPVLELPVHLREEADRLERVERHNRLLDDARMRSLSLGGRSAREAGAGAGGRVNGMEGLEGMMKELQVLGSRLGMDGVGGGGGEGLREAPRAVVGFGAFR